MASRPEHSPHESQSVKLPDAVLKLLGPPKKVVSTPWPGLNAFSAGEVDGVVAGQVVSISSGDHQIAHALLREWHDHLLSRQDARLAWATCQPATFPTPESLTEWTQALVKLGMHVFLDGFPDVGDRHQETDGEVSEYDAIAWMIRELHRIAHKTDSVIVLGARMSEGAKNTIGREVDRHLVRGDGVVESMCRTSMLTCADPGTGELMGWLYNYPLADVTSKAQQWFPLRTRGNG